MSWAIPRSTVITLRSGNQGIVVWSLQRALTAVKAAVVVPDGAFGEATKGAVTAFQRNNGLTADGIAGPKTQAVLVRLTLVPLDGDVPPNLLRGFALMEGGNLLGAVNWSVAGGVDCGAFQRRVYDEDYMDDAVIQRAFDVAYQGRLLRDRLVELRSIFQPRAGTNDRYGGMGAREKAWRLAALNWNYPSAADRLSRTPIRELGSYWTSPATWVTGFGFRFPDGTAVRTPLEWCARYSGVLGDYHGSKGAVTGLVSDWG